MSFKEFQYQERPGIYRTAWLNNTHWPSTPISQSGTEDPRWFLRRKEDNTIAGPLEWLEYQGTDGRVWKAKIHAEYDGATHMVKIWIEHEAEDGTEHDDSCSFAIYDWEGSIRPIKIQSRIPNDSSPGFDWE